MVVTHDFKEIFFPKNLSQADIDRIFTGYGRRTRVGDKVRVLLDYMIKQDRQKRITKIDPASEEPIVNNFDGFIQVHSDILRMIFGNSTGVNGYKRVINLLKEAGIIRTREGMTIDFITGEVSITEGSYKPGERCIEYQIVGYDDTVGYKHVKLNLKNPGDAKINKKMKEIRDAKLTDDLIIKMLSEYTYNLKIKDTQHSRRIIRQFYEEMYKEVDGFNFNLKDFLTLFNGPGYQNRVDAFGMRLHSKLTNLKKELRKYLYFEMIDKKGNRVPDPEPVVILDISNSQPFLSSIINSYLVAKFCPEFANVIPVLEKYIYRDDYQEFQRDCVTANIYEKLMEFWLSEYGCEITRKEAKRIFFMAAYTNYSWKCNPTETKVQTAAEKCEEVGKEALFAKDSMWGEQFKILCLYSLKTLYPSFYYMNKEIKKMDFGKANPSESYTNNCCIAQRLESGIFFKTICRRLITERGKNGEQPMTKIATIHDAILCRACDAQRVKEVMEDCFDELVGIIPNIEIDDCKPERKQILRAA
jgi:hypothetical protein